MPATLNYSLAASILGGLVLQAILLLFTQNLGWPGSWIANLVITVVIVSAFAAKGWLDAAKGVAYAACIRAIFTLILLYSTAVIGGKIPYGGFR